MSVRSVTVEFQKWDYYLIPNDINGGESFREHLTIQWEGGAFLVFDEVHGNVHEVTVFTQNNITNELEAVTAMIEWAEAHEAKKEDK
jgi:hypothetical protein